LAPGLAVRRDEHQSTVENIIGRLPITDNPTEQHLPHRMPCRALPDAL
jgi:hypothetical protein